MYIHCSRCHEPTWIRSLVPGLVEPSIKCPDCGEEHDLSRSSKLGETGKEQYELASEFAARNAVDLPTAYSILLGLMTLEEARASAAEQREEQRKKTNPPETPEPRTDEPVLEVGTTVEADDEPSIEIDRPVLMMDSDDPEESITPRPRDAPGPRRRFSNAARHRRPRPREQKVTIHVEREMAKERFQLTPRQIITLGVLAVLMLGLSGRHVYLTWRGLVEEGKTAQRNTVASAEAVQSGEGKALARAREKQSGGPEALKATIQRDDKQRVTRVTGPNPMAVLKAYCRAASGTYEREPLELAQASPPTADERFGIFRDFSRLETNRAIRIVQDRATSKWVVGDGMSPIPTREAPAEPDTIRRASLDDAL